MAISPAALDAMVRNGATAEMIADVVKADLAATEAAVIAATDARRARAAEAKRAQRAALREAVKVLQSPQDMEGQQRTCEDIGGLVSPKKEGPPHPLRKNTPSSSLRSETQIAGGWFSELWVAYPKKPGNGRQAAEDKFCRLLKAAKNPEALAREIIEGAKRFAEARAGEDPQFTPLTATWLNRGQWKDDHSRPTASPPGSGPRGGGSPRYSGPSMSTLASLNSVSDLFESPADVPRDRDPFPDRSDATDARVQGFTGRLREQDRGDARGEIFNLRRAYGG